MLYTAPFGASSLRVSKTNLKDQAIFQPQLNITIYIGVCSKVRTLLHKTHLVRTRKSQPFAQLKLIFSPLIGCLISQFGNS